MRTVIIGDVGGHSNVFRRLLAAAGVGDTLRVPEGVTIVQVGDLVHKGPDSDECVALAGKLLARNPSGYVQLVGNHEAHYLGGPSVAGRPGVIPVARETRATLRSWWRDGLMKVAHPIVESVELGPVLVTHGGLTVGCWRELGSPGSPEEAAALLNGAGEELVFRPGALMTGRVDESAGPLCPRAGAELAAGWLRRGTMPFSQVHGHEGVWFWPENGFHDDVPVRVREASTVDPVRRFCAVRVGQRVLFCVDPVLGTIPPDGFNGATLELD